MRHKWTKTEENEVYEKCCIGSLSAKELKRLPMFASKRDISIQAITDKKGRLIDEHDERLVNIGKPWTGSDSAHLRVHIDEPNETIKFQLGRSSSELNAERLKIRKLHGLGTWGGKASKKKIINQLPINFDPEEKSVSRQKITFHHTPEYLKFTLSCRVTNTKVGLRALIKELQDTASTIERNDDFRMKATTMTIFA